MIPWEVAALEALRLTLSTTAEIVPLADGSMRFVWVDDGATWTVHVAAAEVVSAWIQQHSGRRPEPGTKRWRAAWGDLHVEWMEMTAIRAADEGPFHLTADGLVSEAPPRRHLDDLDEITGSDGQWLALPPDDSA